MAKEVYLEQAQAVALKALASGGEVRSQQRVEWDIAGRCSGGFHRRIVGRASMDDPTAQERLHREMGRVNRLCIVDVTTPCRVCDACREARKRLWRLRASSEIGCSVRTWFGTLTLSPESQHLMLQRARVRLGNGGTDFELLGAKEAFIERSRETLAEATLWLKRVRKEARSRFRYLLVVEAHKSGLPHLHYLLHEPFGQPEVRLRTLKDQWKLGFSDVRLVEQGDTRAAAYVAKYLAKSALTRVRASTRYGQGQLVASDLPRALLRHSEPQ